MKAYHHGLFSMLLPYLEQNAIYDSLNLKGATANVATEKARYTVIGTYICPSFTHPTVYGSNDFTTNSQPGALTTYQGVAGSVVGLKDCPGKNCQTDSSFGNVPFNGIFQFGRVRAVAEVTDGLSNTLALGEFVHYDSAKGALCDTSVEPGNLRPWIITTFQNYVTYQFKVIYYGINARVERCSNPMAMYNWLPMTSSHPDGVNFTMGDGSVHFLSNSLDTNTYVSLSTCNGGENVSLP